MKISVITPTIRSEKLIEFQLPSFANQTFSKKRFEIVIIDDYADRKELIEKFGKENGMNITWIHSKTPYYRSNANIGCARNTGLIYAKGKLVVFIDDFSYVKPSFLEKIWKIYNDNHRYSHIGPVISLEYKDPPGNIDKLKVLHGDQRSEQRKKLKMRRTAKCSAGWFYTSNASAPLKNLIKVNGFWEMADLTREEDVLMGLALERNGIKFYFLDDPDTAVYHMSHDRYKIERKYKEISFKDLGWEDKIVGDRTIVGYGGHGKNGLKTNLDEIQRVTKDIFHTKYPGSWALIEVFRKHKKLKFNSEFGFNLKEERKKIGNWT